MQTVFFIAVAAVAAARTYLSGVFGASGRYYLPGSKFFASQEGIAPPDPAQQ